MRSSYLQSYKEVRTECIEISVSSNYDNFLSNVVGSDHGVA